MWPFIALITIILVGSLLAIICIGFCIISIADSEWKRAWFFLTAIGGLFLLAVSSAPGRFEMLFFDTLFLILSLPLLLLWFTIPFLIAFYEFIVWLFWHSRPQRKKWGMRTAGLVLLISLILVSNVIMSIVFSVYADEFQSHIKTASAATVYNSFPNMQIGSFFVDRITKDSRGGVYFRTATGPDGLGPDTMSYGFAYRPNSQGAPFGNSSYGLTHLFGDWFEFSASDD